MKKRMIWIILAAVALVLAACGKDVPEQPVKDDAGIVAENDVGGEKPEENNDDAPVIPTYNLPADKGTWSIYWYLCGSNLESFYGCASNDLEEAMAAQLPDNVRVVIETGGAYQWHNEFVRSGAIQRYVLDNNGLSIAEELPDADMGEAGTLASFLTFCEDNFPAEHKMLLFWNHGGGSVSGAAFDEAYGYDSLTLKEFSQAFSDVYGTIDKPFDIVGFDTCLMSTVDVANTFKDVADYLVASEELEPGCGWHYTGWLGALAANPQIDGLSLSRKICDTYLEECRNQESDYEITLAVTDLEKVGHLTDTYNALGNEALLSALENPNFLAHLGREARVSENYGGNTREQGFTNMVDLGHLVRNCAELFPTTANHVLDALSDCVVYKVNGPYRAEATGLSCYYSYNADIEDFADYTVIGASEAFKYLYAYGLTGKLSDAGIDYVGKLKISRSEENAAELSAIGRNASEEKPLAYYYNDGTAAKESPKSSGIHALGRSEKQIEQVPTLLNSAAKSRSRDASITLLANGDIYDGDPAGGDGVNGGKYPNGRGDEEKTDSFDWYTFYKNLEEQQRQEEEQRALEEQQRQEEEQRRQEEEQRALEEQQRQEEERRRLEEQRQREAAWRRAQQQQQAELEAGDDEDEQLGGIELPDVPTVDTFDPAQAVRAYVTGEGYPALDLDPAFADSLAEIRVHVRQAVTVDSEPGRIDLVDWGESDLINTNWTDGTVYAWFGGYWAALDDTALHMEICYESDAYTLYSAPIMLNGEICNLHIAYEKQITKLPNGATQTDYDWHILGARKALDATGMADKFLIKLKPGDEIIPIYYVKQDAANPDSEWAYYYQEENKIIYSDESQLDLMEDFGDAVYEIQYEFIDCRNQSVFSERFCVQIVGDRAITQLWKDYTASLNGGIERYR